MKKKVYICLDERIYAKLDTLAEETCRTRSGYIRRIITAYLRDIEEHPEHKLD